MARDIDFKFGTLFRTDPDLTFAGRWEADLDESVRNAHSNADLTITIRLYLKKIDPQGRTSRYADADDEARLIQTWKPGEFETFKRNLLSGAQRFWDGAFWLKTPSTYSGLNWPDDNATHRCNIRCRFGLIDADTPREAHYTIAAVRVPDGERFRTGSAHYIQRDIEPTTMIPHSTVKFWRHFHEVGHLLGLGHVNQRDILANGVNDPAAYGVTKSEQEDAMGRGSVRHEWHASPWQEAAAAFTGTKKEDWGVSMRNVAPVFLPRHGRK
jgi:hypothetical protein